MKAHELRIGNYVIFGNNANSTTEEIVAINNTDWFDEGKKYWLETKNLEGELLNDFQPILLTEEWLLKFGFKYCGDYFYSIKTGVAWTTLEVCPDCCRIIVFNKKKLTFVELKYHKYVHQLQNLYFALTGQELTIKK